MFTCGKITVFLVTAVVLGLWWRETVGQSYRRNGEPININWVFSLPYDVSNTLRSPLGGPLSLVLSGCLSIIMFFSLAVSPVYYLLGTPHRDHYSWHDAILATLQMTTRESKPRMMGGEGRDGGDTAVEAAKYPDFVKSLFWLIGEDDRECQKLMVCHSHGFFNFLPDKFFMWYGIFSRRMMDIPEDFQEAIENGLEAQSSCLELYPNCSHSIVDISKKTFSRIIPKDLRTVVGSVKRIITWLAEFE